MALTKLTTDLIDGSLGTDWQATPKTASFTAVAGEGYFVDTTSTAITVSLPSSPTAGDDISLIDYGANASTNNITITSSDNIEGAADDLALSTDKSSTALVYSDATKGWVIANGGSGGSVSEVLIDYLVVAGGGGTDAFSGGGGAGGLRTSFGTSNGGGSDMDSGTLLSTSSTYAVTVGAGGTGVGYVAPGGTATGSNSLFGNITSNGGGGGSYQTGPTGGGSGGGAGCGSNPGSYPGGTRSTSPTIQGYNGGNSGPRNGTGYPTGGGGGAGAAGQNYVSGTQSGNGGVGLEVNIIGGTGNYYAGGGGGTVHTQGTPGTGGNGGGGNGGKENSSNGTGGTANTGGGAGGSPSNASSRNNGGSGIVILRYSSDYTISIGAGLTGSTATDGSDNVTTFTAGTGNISFS